MCVMRSGCVLLGLLSSSSLLSLSSLLHTYTHTQRDQPLSPLRSVPWLVTAGPFHVGDGSIKGLWTPTSGMWGAACFLRLVLGWALREA